MKATTAKLARKLDDAALAEKLAGAGFTAPTQIEQATDRELRGLAGLDQAELERVRAVFPEA